MAHSACKAIFFDFDDTLQDREAAYLQYCDVFLDRYFPELDAQDREQKKREMELYVEGGYRSREEYFPLMIEYWGWKPHPPVEELCAHFNGEFGRHVVLLPGAREVLEELRRREYPLGMITNGISVLQNTKLDTSGLRPLFSYTYVSGDLPFAKPDRRIFERAAEESGYAPETCAFVGDHPVNDIAGARSAGMQAVRMDFGFFKGQDFAPDVPVIHTLQELLALFPGC